MRAALALLLLLATPSAASTLSEKALELRNLGIAQLENEQPAQAEATFRELIRQLKTTAPADPMPDANLALSLLRQQKNDAALEAADQALAKAPGRADLLALRGDILQWSGKADEALAAYRQAAAADPAQVRVQFALFQQAAAVGETDAARAASAEALAALVRLRPENLVVLLKEGQRAIRAGISGGGGSDSARAAATQAFLRVKEILWQAPAPAAASLGQILKALEENNLEAARIPGIRLENVLRITPLYRQSLSELSPGIQGLPIETFAGEPPVTRFGDPLPVRFVGVRIGDSSASAGTVGRALAVGDFDGDGKADIARVVSGGEGKAPRLELTQGGASRTLDLPASGVAGLLAADLDNDGRLDLIAYGPETLRWWRNVGGMESSPLDPLSHLPAPAPGRGGATTQKPGEQDGRGFPLSPRERGPGGEDSTRGTFQTPSQPAPHGGEIFEDATAAAGLGVIGGAGATAAAAIDFDIEGDLDLALVGGKAGAGELFRSNLIGVLTGVLTGALEAVGAATLPREAFPEPAALIASDLDRDGDLDLLVAHSKGLSWLDNLRQGRFGDRTAVSGLAGLSKSQPGVSVMAVVSADLDNDGLPDLIAAGSAGLAAWHNRGGTFEPWPLSGLPDKPALADVLALDADNDGRLDLAAAGPSGLLVLGQRGTPERPVFEALKIEGAPSSAAVLAAADLDADGDLDLLAGGPNGLHRLDNDGGNRNHWLSVRLKALTQGNSKNNLEGLGAVVEVRSGSAYQFREVQGQVTHLGLGSRTRPDLLRVTWTNGVPQNRMQPQGDLRIVEEQLLKGSCPFLYAWDGKGFAFVTDLLWNSPIGLPVAPGVWAGADPGEIVRIDGLEPRREGGGEGDQSRYEIRVTEELWEAAFFDQVRLWVVDHPADVEVASNLKVIPGKPLPEEVKASRGLRPVTAAWDGAGEDATERVRRRDEVYASGFEPSPYQGVTAKPWTFTFDLGEAPNRPVRLHLDGWNFPADASLNLAVAQRSDLPPTFPRVEVETDGGWEILVAEMGFPAGKTKTMVVDTPALPPGAHRLRIVTNQWIAWDRIAWTSSPVDSEPVIAARLDPATADLRYRGFSQLIRRSPNGPHGYLYERSTAESPWLPFPGRYTRYGDVKELLLAADDRTVILAPGDEIALTFDAKSLPPVRKGWTRTLFLESQGWDKDADRNTFEASQVEPLPFRAMKRYGDPLPDTPELRRYLEEWLTRDVKP